MRRLLLVRSMVVLAIVGVVSGQVCVACSLDEGCYPYSELVDDTWYRSEVIDTSGVASSPYIVVDTLTNNTSSPMPGMKYSYTDVSGWGIVAGLTWELVRLGFEEYSESRTEVTCQYTVPPRSMVAVSTALKYQDRVLEVEQLLVMYCQQHHQLWTISVGTNTVTERNLWTAVSLSEESLLN